MKHVLIILFLLSNIRVCSQIKKELIGGNSIATYSLAFGAGFSDGLADCVIANKFYYAPFWGYEDWQKRGNLDGFHVAKGTTYVLWSAALAINIGEKKNWKIIVAKGVISLAASRLGHELCYNVIFKNYPK